MNLDDLQTIKTNERQTDSLQPLSGSFYEEVGNYLAELREERERIAADRGFDDPAFRRLSDEIDTAEDTVEAIYDRRVGKVVKAASFAAAGMPAEDNGLTDEERALFETLVEEIAANRERVLAVLGDEGGEGGGPSPSGNPTQTESSNDSGHASTTDQTPAEDAPDRSPAGDGPGEASPASQSPQAAESNAIESEEARADADPPEGNESDGDEPARDGVPSSDGGEPTASSPRQADVARATVHITRDVGEILGVDERAYELARGDVVTLPEENAAPLLERDAAERLE